MSKWEKFVKGIVSTKNYIKSLVYDYGLETLLFGIALGNAEVLHQYLITTGSTDSWQLTLAIYATEILVVWASLWRTVGLGISFVLFLVSMVSISSVFGNDWFGHSGFSLAIFSGSVGNYVRRGGWKELGKAYEFVTGKVLGKITSSVLDLAGWTTADIRTKLGLSLDHANIIKTLRDKGVLITEQLVKDTKC